MSAEREPSVVEQILAKLSRVVGREGVKLPPIRRPVWCPGAMLERHGKPWRRQCNHEVAVQTIRDQREVPDNEREPDRHLMLGLCWSCSEAEKSHRAELRQQAAKSNVAQIKSKRDAT